jgi:hypothetical protein
MIDPYEAALQGVSEKFQSMGFKITRNNDYAATLSNGEFLLDFSTDRYRHPSLAGVLTTPAGKKYELGLLRSILSPVAYEADMQALKAIRGRFDLDKPPSDRTIRREGILEYVRTSLDQVHQFLLREGERVFSLSIDLDAEYSARSREMMSKMVKYHVKPN